MKIKNTKLFKEENLNLILVMGILAVGIIIISMSGCVGPKPSGNETINNTANETIEEKVTGDNVAEIKYTTGEGKTSMEYISVGSGKYSFENEIIGMKVGDKKDVAYNKPVAVRLTQEPEENKVYIIPNGEIKVFNVTNTEIFLGHKLAGETLNFSIKVKNIDDIGISRKTCLSKYNVSMDTVAFLHSTTCPHCVKMIPWVKNMENESYKFLWIDGSDAEKTKIAQECLADVLNFASGVPQFGCPSNGKLQLGEFPSPDDMKNFAEECKKAAEEITEETGKEIIVKSGSAVEVEYVGKLLSGEKFDEGAIKFVAGAGQMIKGFDEAVIGMKINESKNITIPPEKAYGFPQPEPREIQQDISIDQFKQVFNEEPVLNKEYANPQAIPWPVKVVEIKTDSYNYTIEILDVMTNEEFLDILANKKPEVEVFVMSHCPYGTQVEKGIIPVHELLGDKVNINIRFVHYIMHGQKEADEQARQYCIDKEQKDKFWSYLACFLEKGDSTECLDRVGVDKDKVQTCMAAADKEFSISVDLASGQQYPRFRIHEELSNQYGVQGSPTLVINDNKVQVGRDPESLKSAICDAFPAAKKPAECGQTLSSAAPSPGFGFSEGGSGSTGSCG